MLLVLLLQRLFFRWRSCARLRRRSVWVCFILAAKTQCAQYAGSITGKEKVSCLFRKMCSCSSTTASLLLGVYESCWCGRAVEVLTSSYEQFEWEYVERIGLERPAWRSSQDHSPTTHKIHRHTDVPSPFHIQHNSPISLSTSINRDYGGRSKTLVFSNWAGAKQTTVPQGPSRSHNTPSHEPEPDIGNIRRTDFC